MSKELASNRVTKMFIKGFEARVARALAAALTLWRSSNFHALLIFNQCNKLPRNILSQTEVFHSSTSYQNK
jgi:hypothetical protein